MFRQRCFYRQCPRLNPRLGRKESSVDVQRDVEQIEEEILVSFLSTDFGLPGDLSIDSQLGDIDNLTDPIENIVEDNRNSAITDIIEEIVSSAWGEVNKTRDSENKDLYQRKRCYPCAECGRLFAQYASSLKHCNVKKIKDTGAVCPVCGKKVLLKRNLKRHMNTVHDPNKTMLSPETSRDQAVANKCEQCDKVYSSKNKLVEHMHKKHGVVRKGGPLIQCSECDFSHISKSRVKAHFTLTHNSEHTFKCTLCGISFRSKSGLQKHTNNVHKPRKSSNPTMSPEVPEIVLAHKSHPPISTNYINLSQSIAAKHYPLSRVVGHGSSPGYSAQNLLPVRTAYQHALQSAPVGQNPLPLEFSGQNQIAVGQNQLRSDFSGQNVLPKPACLPSSQFPHVEILSRNTSCVIMAHTPTGFSSQNVSQVLRYNPQPDKVSRGNTHCEQINNPAIPVNKHGDLVNVQGVAVNSYSMMVNKPGVPVNTHGFLVNSCEDTMDNSVPFENLNMIQNENSPSLNINHYDNIFTESGYTYQNL